jgi:hypothetical protein
MPRKSQRRGGDVLADSRENLLASAQVHTPQAIRKVSAFGWSVNRLSAAVVVQLVLACSEGGGAGQPDARDGGDLDGASDVPGEVGEPSAPRVALSEVMYHPVGANSDDNNHEFIELHNPGAAPIDLSDWKLGGEVQFTFPAGSSIAPGQYLVVAKKRAKLLALAKYQLAALADQVLGDYSGSLDDGHGRVVLTDASGAGVDAVAYDDGFPWPLAADAFGAGESWFEEAAWFPAADPRRNLAAHKYLGHSLERVSFTLPSSLVANWTVSPLDGATPARPNTNAGTPPAIVEQLSVFAEATPDSPAIGAMEPVRVRARLTAGSPISNVTLEYWAEFERGRPKAPAPIKVAMTPGPDGHEAVIPGQLERTVVRYRIVGERTPGMPEVISPRPTDPVPYGHHLFYVGAPVGGKPHYELFVSPDNWGKMWTNISPDGPVLGCPADYLDQACAECVENPGWNARVPGVMVFGGQAYDMRARYQGSLEGRTNAEDIGTWPPTAPRPTVGPLKAMSWSITLPRYRRFEGMGQLVLNRLNQSCPGLSHALAAALDEDPQGGRIPAPHIRRWARVFVNGVPYNYMMDLERIGDEYLERFHGKGQTIGDVYKIFSSGDDLGPWAPGFGQVILPSSYCPEIPVRTRYEKTYKRESNDFRSIDELMNLIVRFSAARDTANPAKVRTFLQENFDVDATLKYYVVQQWGAPWDDNGKNYNLYKLPPQAVKPGGGAFTVTSWDVDRMFGVGFCPSDADCPHAEIPIYCDDVLPKCNRWKRAFLETMKAEYDAKMKQLNETIFQPANIARLADENIAGYDMNEAQQMASPPLCDVVAETASVKRFAQRRYLAVRKQLGY